MAIITLPSTPGPARLSWRLVQPDQLNRSEWTGARQVLASGRGWWECDYVLPPVKGDNFNPWRSFFAQMKGRVNTCQVPVSPTAQSSLSNTVQVNGASQTGRTLATDGWPANSTPLTAGQYVTVNGELLILTADVTANGSGQATLSFEPALRRPPDDNATVEYKNPYAEMHLTATPGYSVDPGDIYSTSAGFSEAF